MGGEGKWTRLTAATSKSTRASCCGRQCINGPKRHALYPGNNHLGDSHAPRHREWLGSQIHQRYHQLAPVIAVNRRRCVGQGDTVAERQTGSRPQLALETLWYRNAETGSEQPTLERCQLPLVRAGQVITCRAWCSRARNREPIGMRQAGDQDLDRGFRGYPFRQRC